MSLVGSKRSKLLRRIVLAGWHRESEGADGDETPDPRDLLFWPLLCSSLRISSAKATRLFGGPIDLRLSTDVLSAGALITSFPWHTIVDMILGDNLFYSLGKNVTEASAESMQIHASKGVKLWY